MDLAFSFFFSCSLKKDILTSLHNNKYEVSTTNDLLLFDINVIKVHGSNLIIFYQLSNKLGENFAL